MTVRRFGKRLLAVLCTLPIAHALAADATRIVSLAPHLTELTFSAGAGDRVVATVEYSDYPEQARVIPRIGDAFRVDLERLVALRPDAILVWDSGTPAATIARLRELELPVYSFTTHRLTDIPEALRRIGELAGSSEAALEAASRFEEQIANLRRTYRDREVVSVFLQINDRPLYTVNGRHLISEIADLCGGRNVFAELSELAPAIGEEAVIAANPQVIIATSDTVIDAPRQWQRWRQLDAVRRGNIYTLDSDNLTRATLRTVRGVEAMCETLDSARERLSR